MFLANLFLLIEASTGASCAAEACFAFPAIVNLWVLASAGIRLKLPD